jgi:stage III sporulation protein AD
MDIIKLIGVALVCAIIILYLKNIKPELAFSAAVASGIILLLMIISMLTDVISFFTTITEKTGIDSTLFETVLKIVGVGYLIEFSAGLIEDFGSKSIADKLVLGGKIIILIIAMPIIQSMLLLIVSLLE